MRRLAFACLLAFAVAACGGKKEQPVETGDEVECESDEDCDQGDVCRDSECVASERKKIKARSNNVSPESVKREVEIRQKQHERRVDKSLGL